MTATMFEQRLQACQARVEHALAQWLPPGSVQPTDLHAAMRYSVLGGGKRVRAVLAYGAAEALGFAPSLADAPACAVEIIHAYSLIHDDLPAMDDDDLRRGRPTNHKVFGEAVATLAGDALQALAFHVLASDRVMPADAAGRLEMVNTLAMASGSRGMAGGQAIDLAAEGMALSLPELENMHIHKTGALIRASVLLGARCAPGASPAQLAALDTYGKCIGLAFQIHDDVLDETGDTATLGKPQGSDRARHKSTFPALLGLAASRTRAQELCDEAVAALTPFGERASLLADLARYIVSRNH